MSQDGKPVQPAAPETPPAEPQAEAKLTFKPEEPKPQPKPEPVVNDRPAMRLRAEASFAWRAAMGFACIALLGGVWWAITLGAPEERVVPIAVLPSPWETFASFPSLWFESALSRNLVASLWRVIQGFGLAVLIGVPLGIVAATWPKVNAFIAPVSLFGRNVPISALVPLSLVWFGIDETQKIMFIFFACIMFITFDAVRSVAGVHERYVQTALTLGARPLQVLAKVLVPLALPHVFASLRSLFGLAFGYIIVAEMVNAEYGLGHLILIAQRRGPLAHVYLILMVITIVAYVIDRALHAVERALFPYKEA